MATEKLNDTTFESLLKVDVTKRVKVKGSGKQAQKYLSWTYAWEMIKKTFPDANYKVLNNSDGMPYFADDFGIMIKTEVTINNETLSMWLPVLDGAMKAMKRTEYAYKVKKYVGVYPNTRQDGFEDKYVSPATMFDINTATMRCLVKNFAMFGLGLNLYTGEDFTEIETINLAQNSEIMSIIQSNNLNLKDFCSFFGMQKPTELLSTNFNDAINFLNDIAESKLDISDFVNRLNATKSS
jgi:hypothetical protein